MVSIILLVLSSCSTRPAEPSAQVGASTGFEFYVEPQAEVVTLQGPTDSEQRLQSQSSPSDTHILTPYVDIKLKDLSYQFRSAKKLIVRFRVENLTKSDFEQPFFFTLSSESNNIVNATAPLVTDQQLGGNGVLRPGKQSERFQFEVTFKKGKPFTFLVNTSAVAGGKASCTDPVTIPDANLAAAIRDELRKSAGAVTCADLESLTEFLPGNYSIVN